MKSSALDDIYRDFLQRSSDGISLADETGRIVEWNPAMETMLGLKACDVLGKPIWDVQEIVEPPENHSPGWGEERKALVLKLIATETVQGVSITSPIQRPDGQRRVLEQNAFTIHTPNGPLLVGTCRDISDQMQAEEQLRLQSTALSASANAIVITNRDGAIQWVNPAFSNLTGYTAEEAHNQNPRILKSSLHDEAFYHQLWATILAGNIWQGQMVNKRKDGTFYNEEMTITPVKEADERVTHFIAVKQNVTARVQAEAALSESEIRFRMLAENAQDFVFRVRTRPDFHFEYASPSALAITGYTPEALYQADIVTLEMIHPDDRQRLREVIQHPETLEKPIVLRWLHKNGHIVWAETRIVVTHNEQGEISGFEGIARDISERVHHEQALQASEQRYRQLLDTLQEGIWVIDKDANTSFVNPRMADMLGYTIEEMAGRHLFSFMDAQGIEIANANLQRRQQGIAEQHDFEFIRKDGSRIYTTIATAPLLDEQGRYNGAIAGVTDITARRKAETLLRALYEIDRAIITATSPQAIAEVAVTHLARLIPCQRISLTTFDYAMDQIVCLAMHGSGSANALPLDALLSNIKRMSAGEIVQEDPREFAGQIPALQKLAAEGVCHIAHIPLNTHGRLIGSLNLGYATPEHCKAQDVTIASQVAASLAVALENASLLEAERAARQELRDLAGYLQAAREEERAHVAREIHDDFGQSLTSLKMDLAWLARHIPSNKPQLSRKTAEMLQQMDKTIDRVRSIATELRPGMLDDLGLTDAIEWQAQEFSRRTEIQSQLELSTQDTEIERDLATAIFRIFQEILTNITRHAEASQVKIKLTNTPQALQLTVCDNGKGISEEHLTSPASLGLIGMRERAHAFGGDVHFESQAGTGTTVVVTIPHGEDFGSL